MATEYDSLLHTIIDPLIVHPDSIMIRVLEDDGRNVTILVVAEDEDCARLIGKHGAVANTLREVVSMAGKASENEKHIRLKFESFEDESDGK